MIEFLTVRFLSAKSGEVSTVDPAVVYSLINAADVEVPDDALIRQEIYLRGKLVDHLNEMSYSHHMYTQVRAEYDKQIKIMGERKIKIPQSS